jgi:hypothetical protein
MKLCAYYIPVRLDSAIFLISDQNNIVVHSSNSSNTERMIALHSNLPTTYFDQNSSNGILVLRAGVSKN